MIDKILERAKSLSTSALSDAVDSFGIDGGLIGCVPRTPGQKFAGYAFTVKYIPYSKKPLQFQNAGNYIDDVSEGEVVVIDNGGRQDCSSWGGILTAVAKLRNLTATVVYGSIRDRDEIQDSSYPVYSCGIFMQSGKNRSQKISQQEPVMVGSVQVHPGDLICGDASGVVAIPRGLAEKVVTRAEIIEQTESKILEAVKEGLNLAGARKKFGYHEPWKN